MEIASIAAENKRGLDSIGRYGGEEITEFIDISDKKLSEAKSSGRNRIGS